MNALLLVAALSQTFVSPILPWTKEQKDAAVGNAVQGFDLVWDSASEVQGYSGIPDRVTPLVVRFYQSSTEGNVNIVIDNFPKFFNGPLGFTGPFHLDTSWTGVPIAETTQTLTFAPPSGGQSELALVSFIGNYRIFVSQIRNQSPQTLLSQKTDELRLEGLARSFACRIYGYLPMVTANPELYVDSAKADIGEINFTVNPASYVLTFRYKLKSIDVPMGANSIDSDTHLSNAGVTAYLGDLNKIYFSREMLDYVRKKLL